MAKAAARLGVATIIASVTARRTDGAILASLYVSVQIAAANRRRLGCARHVRAAGVANLDHRALGVGSVARGSRCHRSVCSSRFLAASPARLPPFPAPWALHHLGVLVHGLDVICKSRSDDCAFALGHLCGHRACRDCPIHVGPVCRNALRDRACALALGNRCVHTSQTKITPAIVRFRFIDGRFST